MAPGIFDQIHPRQPCWGVNNGGGQEKDEMKYEAKGSEMVVRSQVTSRLGTTEKSRNATPATWRDAAKRNFILQLGFEDPAPAVLPRQYSALVVQPKIVLAWIVVGILFQSPAVSRASAPFCGGVPCFRN